MPITEKRNGYGDAGRVMQDQANRGITENVPSWIRNGAMVTGLKIEAGEEKQYTHKLGRALAGYLVLNVRSDASGENDLVCIASTANTIKLKHLGAGALRFDLWVW